MDSLNRLTIVTSIFFVFFSIHASSQLKMSQAKNTIYADVASIYVVGMSSINYERLIYSWHALKLYGNASFGGCYKMETGVFTDIIDGKSTTLNLVLLVGGRNHHFETNLGARYVFFDDEWEKRYNSLYPEINIGYRFQWGNGRGLLFKFFVGSTGIGIGLGKAF